MNLQSIGIRGLAAMGMVIWIGSNSNAQTAGSGSASSASHVTAEMTKGKLNPEESKPGDQVALKLKNDVRANGDVVLKKGTTITGVVRSVKRLEGQPPGQAQSLMEIEWLVPDTQGRTASQLSIALQSVIQIYGTDQAASSEDFSLIANGPPAGAGTMADTVQRGSGLVGAAAGATTSVASGVPGPPVGSARTIGQSNAALMSMPSIMAADDQTATLLEDTFGMKSSTQLYKVGRGELISPVGSKQSIDLFTHLSNDTVITSQSKNFEISSGAQMQLLVGVSRK